MSIDVSDERAELADLLIRYASRMSRLLDEALSSISVPLSLAQFGIMDRAAQGDVTMSEHARAAHRTISSISTTVNGLVRQGLLCREQGGGDGRVVFLRLTPDGSRVLDEARAARRELGEWALSVGGDALLPVYQALKEHYDRLSPRVGASVGGKVLSRPPAGQVPAAP